MRLVGRQHGYKGMLEMRDCPLCGSTVSRYVTPREPLLLFFLAVMGNIIDTVGTLHNVARGFTEANPVMAPLMRHPWAFLFVKLVITPLALLGIMVTVHRSSTARWGLRVVTVFYVAVAVWQLVLWTSF